MPLICYRTSDVTSIIEDECPCVHIHTRPEKVVGRMDDMPMVRGINVFISRIEGVLVGIPGVAIGSRLLLTAGGISWMRFRSWWI